MDLSRATRSVETGFDVVRYLPGWLLPVEFTVTWDDGAAPVVRMDVHVGADGRPHCKRVTVTSRGEPDVTGTDLRDVPVARFLDDAVAYAVMREDKSGRLPLFKSAEDFRAFRQLRPRHRERERWRLTPEHLREVVRVYRQGGRAGVLEVARHFDIPRATASRWVQKAKAETYFDEPEKATKRKKGAK